MHLVGFIIRVYHDARSPERQIHIESYSFLFCSEMIWLKPGIVVSKGKVRCVYSISCCLTTAARWIGCVLLVIAVRFFICSLLVQTVSIFKNVCFLEFILCVVF